MLLNEEPPFDEILVTNVSLLGNTEDQVQERITELKVLRPRSGRRGPSALPRVSNTTAATGMFTCAWPDCLSSASRQYCEFWGRPWQECTLPEKETTQTQGKMFGAMVDEEITYEHAQELIDRAEDLGTDLG